MKNCFFFLFLLFCFCTYAIEDLSLDEKVGQVFFSIIYGDTLEEDTKEFIDNTYIGNFLLFAWSNKLDDIEKTKKLCSDLQAYVKGKSHIPPFIAIDHEGGRVQHLKTGMTKIPSARIMGQCYSLDQIYDISKIIASELVAIGININFAPVVDICSDSSFWIYDRCFGYDVEKVILIAKNIIKGFHEEGLLATIKHYPGHGSVIANSHYSYPILHKTLAELEKEDLLPYIVLKDITDAIMIGHILVPSIDTRKIASLSKHLLIDLLRQKYHYEGLIISDSLAMRSVVPLPRTVEEAIHDMTEAAIEAFNAGCDCMVLSKLKWADFPTTAEEDMEIIQNVILSFKQAVKEGRISLERLDESVNRILTAKGL